MKDSLFRKEFFFIDSDIVSLRLLETVEGNGDELPFYWWSIVENRTGGNVGKISLRLGHNYHSYWNGNVGYEVTRRGSKFSGSKAKIVLTLNSSKHRNIKQIQISPGSSRHGNVPYVKISTSDYGKIKIIGADRKSYKTDGQEKAHILFRRVKKK